MTARSLRPWLAVVTLVIVLGAATGLALAAAGDLDTSFDGDGRQTVDFTTAGRDEASGVAVQADGKIVTVGSDATTPSDLLAVARHHPNGSLDLSFSGDGKHVVAGVEADSVQGSGVAIQPDGKIVLAGAAQGDFAVVRLTSTGEEDPDFGGGDGIVTTDFAGNSDLAAAVAIQPDGMIVAAGDAGGANSSEFGIARYDTDGDPDSNFGTAGEQMVAFPTANSQNAHDMALQEDGKIVVAGRVNFPGVASVDRFGLVRLTSGGLLDADFDGDPGNPGGGDGRVAYADDGYARSVAMGPGSSKIVAAGSIGTDFAVMRLNTADGTLDGGFSGDGIQTTDESGAGEHANAVTVQPDGKVVAAGEYDEQGVIEFLVARYLTDGSLDPSFAGDGTARTSFSTPTVPAGAGAHDVALQADGKAVAVGGMITGPQGDFALARYQADPGPPTPPIVCCAPPRRTLADLPDPVQGVTTNVEPVGNGPVFVGIPARLARTAGGPVRASQKGVNFVPLREARQIPVGSFLDTRRGAVRLQSARDRRGTRQQGTFSSSLFQVLQSRRRSARGLTDIVLKGSSFNRCRRAGRGKRATAAQSIRRRLRANARGRFRTRGRHSAATVRGTVWLTADRCDGTLTRVTRGRVAVRDFRRKRTILLRAGKSYLARAPR